MATDGPDPLTGRCLCGTVRYRITAPPTMMVFCHCTHCRAASGSSFATNVLVAPKDFEIVAGGEQLGTFESRPGKLRHFCTRCGSPIYNRLADGSGLLPVRAGTLDQDPGLRPERHIWVRSKAPWLVLDDDIPKHEKGFDSPLVAGDDRRETR